MTTDNIEKWLTNKSSTHKGRVREEGLRYLLEWLDMQGAVVTRVVRTRDENLKGDPWTNSGWRDTGTIVVCTTEHPDVGSGLMKRLQTIRCGTHLDTGSHPEYPLYYTLFTQSGVEYVVLGPV